MIGPYKKDIWYFYDKWLEERLKRFEKNVNDKFKAFKHKVDMDQKVLEIKSSYNIRSLKSK